MENVIIALVKTVHALIVTVNTRYIQYNENVSSSLAKSSLPGKPQPVPRGNFRFLCFLPGSSTPWDKPNLLILEMSVKMNFI